MDIKSKKFSNNIVLRTVIFIICVLAISTTGLVLGIAASESEVVWSYYFASGHEFYSSLSELQRNLLFSWMPILIPCGIVSVISFLWLVITTGGRLDDGTRKGYLFDRIWTELQVLGIFAAVGFAAFILIDPWYEYFYAHPIRKELMSVGSLVGAGNFESVSIFKVLSDNADKLASQVNVSGIGFALLVAIALWFFLSLVRLVKDRCFFKNALAVQICIYIGGGISRIVMNIVNGGSLMRKIVLLCLGICLLSATVFLAPVMIIVVLVFAPKWVKRFEEIQKGVDEVKSGNLAYKIPIDENGKGDELTRLALGINEISEASNMAVQNELKNQRMKTELISNVSHDLKTPLTSMVTYIDLLKSEGLDSPNAPQYLDVLDKKTERLRKLTEDLFEAAKASSGAMPVNMESVDAVSLINQVMGEMNDRIYASGLEFILKYGREGEGAGMHVGSGITAGAASTIGSGAASVTEYGLDSAAVRDASAKMGAAPKYMVDADGQLLYRVVDNLINNVLKYAQPKSRVYINISEPLAWRRASYDASKNKGASYAETAGAAPNSGQGRAAHRELVLIEIKNISKQALNIDPDELMERFKRGDESRTTEGSGLGLAIAKDLVKLMGGFMEVVIDGDLFKVCVYLNKSIELKVNQTGTPV